MPRLSVFDIFTIGVGPSSSHTLGPWRAAERFRRLLDQSGLHPQRIQVFLYGSLAKTGLGHGTDKALMLGLSGEDPETIPVDRIDETVAAVRERKQVHLGGNRWVSFDPGRDICFEVARSLPFHPNALTFAAQQEGGEERLETYYSIGGGFVVQEEAPPEPGGPDLPFPIDTGEDLLRWCRRTGHSVADIVRHNELAWRTEADVTAGLQALWQTMRASVYRGCHRTGQLPGGLGVKRRAAEINRHLLGDQSFRDPLDWQDAIRRRANSVADVFRWVSAFALAVNEENASFGRVVTAPTNGSAGVIPAVILYYLCFHSRAREDDVATFLLTAGELGSIVKKGATISGAQGGCQAEIGVASAMAAGGLTACLGGTPAHVLMAAEIAMEHHLGLTCDPVGGLVQIPCIERNSMGATKAITASQIALESDPRSARVSLDAAIQTLWETAQDMNAKYKETSEGGLAVQIPVNRIDC